MAVFLYFILGGKSINFRPLITLVRSKFLISALIWNILNTNAWNGSECHVLIPRIGRVAGNEDLQLKRVGRWFDNVVGPVKECIQCYFVEAFRPLRWILLKDFCLFAIRPTFNLLLATFCTANASRIFDGIRSFLINICIGIVLCKNKQCSGRCF